MLICSILKKIKQKPILPLFYLFVFLLPTQLGRHFFFNFSYIAGLLSDYLTPTLYLTDILVLLMLFLELILWVKRKSQRQTSKKIKFKPTKTKLLLLAGFTYFLVTSFFVSSNKWVAFYKLFKLVELFGFAFVVSRIKPKITSVIFTLSLSVVYVSFIAIMQFILQKSIGGLFYWLGERTFNVSTPAIATFSLQGKLFLRAYSTFSHPNVLGGFLAVVLPLILVVFMLFSKQKKHLLLRLFFILSFLLGSVCLFLTFSKASLLVFFFGLFLIFLNKSKNLWKVLQKKPFIFLKTFYILCLFSVVIFYIFPKGLPFFSQNWRERSVLVQTGMNMVLKKPISGFGLNNSVIKQRCFSPFFDGTYIYQPIHNIYLLMLVETGIVGLFLIFVLLYKVFLKSLKNAWFSTFSLILLLVLGFFDHYLFTIQQGQLLFVLFASLAFVRMKEFAFLK